MLKHQLSSTAHERVFIRQALNAALIRLDGRSPTDFRSISITAHRSEMSSTCEVQLGTTSVMAIVTGEIVAPFPDKPSEGSLHFNTEISPMTEVLGVTHSQISRLLERSIRDSQTLDVQSLCVVSGERVWDIRCEVRVVDATGGNLIDACTLAAMGALRAFRKPEVSVLKTVVLSTRNTSTSSTVGGNNGADTVSKIVMHHSGEREPLPLALHHTPLSVTLGVFKRHNENKASSTTTSSSTKSDDQQSVLFLVDPSAQELTAIDGEISFSLNAHKELCSMSKLGGTALSVATVMSAATLALNTVTYLHQRLNEALKVLDDQVIRDRDARQLIAREYRAKVDALRKMKDSNKSSDNSKLMSIENTSESLLADMDMDIDALLEQEANDANAYSGIDRNDPMLQWSNLHQPILLATKKDNNDKKSSAKK